jgi:COP9 signalosome complex subunit 7
LTLLTLCGSPSTLTYSHLLTALDLPSIRALEDLIISSIYAGLLTAKLDTLNSRVNVSSVSPLRDLRPNSVPQMVKVLEEWDARCIGALGEIEGQIKEVRRRAVEVKRREIEHEKAVKQAMALIHDALAKSSGKRGAFDKDLDGGPGEAGTEMDVDEGPGRGRPRGAKRGGGRLAGFAKRLGG